MGTKARRHRGTKGKNLRASFISASLYPSSLRPYVPSRLPPRPPPNTNLEPKSPSLPDNDSVPSDRNISIIDFICNGGSIGLNSRAIRWPDALSGALRRAAGGRSLSLQGSDTCGALSAMMRSCRGAVAAPSVLGPNNSVAGRSELTPKELAATRFSRACPNDPPTIRACLSTDGTAAHWIGVGS
jgi:hypothetical protein